MNVFSPAQVQAVPAVRSAMVGPRTMGAHCVPTRLLSFL